MSILVYEDLVKAVSGRITGIKICVMMGSNIIFEIRKKLKVKTVCTLYFIG